MFCPQCGSTQSEELKFCKVCGVNLYAVMQVVAAREPEEKFDWSKTWVQEMFLSADEKKRRKAELEQKRGITPEIKRYNEIKAGVILSSVGIAIAIFLFIFMSGLIAGNKVSQDAAEIISRLWVAGVIPLFVGIALIINGAVVSKKQVEAANLASRKGQEGLEGEPEFPSLRSADSSEFVPAFSVTEETTKHLGSGKK